MKKNILLVFYLILFINTQLEAANPSSSFPLESSYSINDSWSTGYQVTVTLTNNTNTPTTTWTATFSLPKGESISSFWNGVDTVSGQNITVTNPTWIGGGIIEAGSSTTFGMIITMPTNGMTILNNLTAIADGSSTVSIPAAPTLNAISLQSGSTNSYIVSWNSSTNATSYTLQQATNSSFSNAVTVATGNILSYSVKNQIAGTYYYRVSATNSAGTSSYSNTESVTISYSTKLSAPILNPISNSSESNSYVLSWSSVANATSYTLQASTQSNFDNYTIAYQGSNTSYTVTGQAAGTYYYQVYATDGSITSAFSNVESTTVSSSTLSNPVIEGYWESWNSTDSISSIVGMNVNVIDVAFGTFTSTGNNTFVVSGLDCTPATLTSLVTAAHAAGKKVKISIGGATYGLSGFLTSTAAAQGMANAIAAFVSEYSLDGVDFDIEDYPAASLQVALIENCRTLLGNNAIISYTPKTPAATTAPYNQVIQAAYPYLTDISFMAYDYGSGYTYQQDVTGLEAMGVPASKLYIGLMPGYDDLGVLTSVSNITNAAEYIVSKGLGGIMFWDLNRDLENETGLGIKAATNAAYQVFD